MSDAPITMTTDYFNAICALYYSNNVAFLVLIIGRSSVSVVIDSECRHVERKETALRTPPSAKSKAVLVPTYVSELKSVESRPTNVP